MEFRIAAVVVLYNPSEEVVKCIGSYVSQVERVYVVDNSTQHNTPLIDTLKRYLSVVYIKNDANMGIAYALNIGAKSALIAGFDYLLTMDQDTPLQMDYVKNLLRGLDAADSETIGILSPRYVSNKSANGPETEEIQFTMTSGNILNLKAYKRAGPFLDELFIDQVDHEYCLRLRMNGFKIIQLNKLSISHRPGHIVGVRLFGEEWTFSSHSPARLYYIFRNGLFVAKRYGAMFPEYRVHLYKQLFKEICKIPFESEKLLRIRMIVRAVSAFRSGSVGSIVN